MIALIDYGAGNLTSVRKALAHLDARVTTPAVPADLASAEGVIVPGVGHFEVTGSLGPDWRAAIRDHISRQRPLLGICVGMQWLFEGSAEAPDHQGLALLPGACRLITDDAPVSTLSPPDGACRLITDDALVSAPPPPDGACRLITDDEPGAAPSEPPGGARTLKVPHVGWNSLRMTKASWLLDDVEADAQVYFTHSFAAPLTADCVGATRYGFEFAAAVERDNVGGVQFHPEKSSDVGLRILRNFLRKVS